MSDTRTIRDVLAKKIGWVQQPVEGLIGSSLEQQIAYRKATDYLKALGLDPETVLERMCETCEGAGRIKGPSFGPMTRGFTLPPCPDCDGSGWITVNRITVVPTHHPGPPGPDIAEMLRALRIGRAVLASTPRVHGPSSTPWERGWNAARADFLAAGDPDE